MTIGELDGYGAGLIVCPEPVLPAEWLPTVWGGENGFAELDGANQIAAAVLDHYNRIASPEISPSGGAWGRYTWYR